MTSISIGVKPVLKTTAPTIHFCETYGKLAGVTTGGSESDVAPHPAAQRKQDQSKTCSVCDKGYSQFGMQNRRIPGCTQTSRSAPVGSIASRARYGHGGHPADGIDGQKEVLGSFLLRFLLFINKVSCSGVEKANMPGFHYSSSTTVLRTWAPKFNRDLR